MSQLVSARGVAVGSLSFALLLLVDASASAQVGGEAEQPDPPADGDGEGSVEEPEVVECIGAEGCELQPSGKLAGQVDLDGDGFIAAEDCNDTDASIFPGAPEYCDGVDSNCDGNADEESFATLYDGGSVANVTQDLFPPVFGNTQHYQVPIGATLHICPGTYPTKISAWGGSSVIGIGDRDLVVLDGGDSSWGIAANNLNGPVTIQGLTIANSRVGLDTSVDVVVDDVVFAVRDLGIESHAPTGNSNSLDVYGSVFEGDHAWRQPGFAPPRGIDKLRGELVVTGSLFTDLGSVGGAAWGGAITATDADADVTISGSDFLNNAGARVGAVHLTQCSGSIDDSVFIDNSSDRVGALRIYDASAPFTVSNSEFDCNVGPGSLVMANGAHESGAIFRKGTFGLILDQVSFGAGPLANYPWDYNDLPDHEQSWPGQTVNRSCNTNQGCF